MTVLTAGNGYERCSLEENVYWGTVQPTYKCQVKIFIVVRTKDEREEVASFRPRTFANYVNERIHLIIRTI
jgi:hypothetical protein